ncbi:MAG: hypothetical protein AAFV93_16960 [Chloroflexota bacterium]
MTLVSMLLMISGLALLAFALYQSQSQNTCEKRKVDDEEQTSLLMMMFSLITVFISLFTVIGLS